jgi:hypothetical protein
MKQSTLTQPSVQKIHTQSLYQILTSTAPESTVLVRSIFQGIFLKVHGTFNISTLLKIIDIFVFLAVQHTEQFHNETFPDPESTFSSRNRRSVSCEVGARRVRRSCVIIPPAPPKPTDSAGNVKVLVADNLGFDGKYFFPNQTPNYNLTMFESSCIFWDVVNETWKGEGCRVSTKQEHSICS